MRSSDFVAKVCRSFTGQFRVRRACTTCNVGVAYQSTTIYGGRCPPCEPSAVRLTLFGILIAAQLLIGSFGRPQVLAAEVSPFVPGFDRFGRHGELTVEAAGGLLLTELNCTACHHTDLAHLQPKRGPNLSAAGSRLDGDWMQRFLSNPSGTKPGTTMPDVLSSVPAEERPQAVAALTAFLQSQQQPFPELRATGLHPIPPEFWKRGDTDRGRDLYHQIGCVACHEPEETYEVAAIKPSPLDQLLEQATPDELAELGLSSAARRVHSVPHSNLADKYHDRSLTFFLLDPEAVRPTGRMPNPGLTAVDAADIAAWLLLRDQPKSARRNGSADEAADSVAIDEELIPQGQKLFVSLGCVACHNAADLKAAASAVPLQKLSPQPTGTACWRSGDVPAIRHGQPRFMLDDVQQAAVTAALKSSRQNPKADFVRMRPISSASIAAGGGDVPRAPHVGADRLLFRALQLNCLACHDRNGLGGPGRFRRPYFETVGHVDIGDEGRFPPTLTGVGSKLTSGWLTGVFTGKSRLRPFMTIRMPQYAGTTGKELPNLISRADAVSGNNNARRLNLQSAGVTQQQLVEAGRQLMDVGCVQCHAFKGQALPGTVGVDLEGAIQRLQPPWLVEFLRDPGKLKSRTRMPTFFPNGRSQNAEILNGDTDLQIAAMTAYLAALDKQPIPEKIVQARAQDYELTPQERPLILRTFMPDAGTHAIAVGFSQKVHLAFDAEDVRPAEFWCGRFLDAEGTWFVRFAPPAPPLGDHRLVLPHGPSFAAGHIADNAPWPATAEAAGVVFSGYRLRRDGVPVLLYRVGSAAVEDEFQPDDGGMNGGMKRILTLKFPPRERSKSEVWFRVHASGRLTHEQPGSVTDASGTTIQLTSPEHAANTVGRRSGNQFEWLLPVTADTADDQGVVRLEVRYQW